MLPDTGDGHLLVKATLLKSLDADQGLTKRRAQTLVRQRRENQAELVKSKHTLVISKMAYAPKSSVPTKSQGSRSVGFTKEPTSPTAYAL